MDKNEYYKLSKEKGLGSRCPLLDYCTRRAYTIFLFKYYEIKEDFDYVLKLIDYDVLHQDFIEKRIRMSGEFPEGYVGKISGSFKNVCPEVNLFDDTHAIKNFAKTACSHGDWDDEYNQKRIFEERHYSECPEFSNFYFDNILTGSTPKQETSECYTYLMKDNNNGHYKIGISKSPEFREKTLQSDQPNIETIAHRKFMNRKLAKQLENELHNKFSHKRKRGEWFDLNEREIDEILSILND